MAPLPPYNSSKNHHPFGMLMPGRSYSSTAYKYGFNGQEKDDEVAGSGNINTAMFWEYDTRLGRRWNLDPKPTIGISDYACFANSPILNIDVLGDVVDHNSFKDKVNTFFARLTSKSFRQEYNQLKKSDQLYIFNGSKQYSKSDRGEVTLKGDNVMINYSWGKPDRASGTNRLATLKHETTHGVQFDDGKFGFVKVDGEWRTANNDMIDEYEGLQSGYRHVLYKKYKDEDGYSSNTDAQRFNSNIPNAKMNVTNAKYPEYQNVQIQKVNANSVMIRNANNYFRPYNPKSPNPSNAPIQRVNAGVPVEIILPKDNNGFQWR